jgi:hypothetical protein
MSTFTVMFKTDNAAFDGDAGGPEVARILRDLAGLIEECGLVEGAVQRVKDINGHRVGFAVLQEGEVK